MRNIQFESVSQPSGNLYNRHTGSLIFRGETFEKNSRENGTREFIIIFEEFEIRERLSPIRSLGNFAREEARVKSDSTDSKMNGGLLPIRERGKPDFPRVLSTGYLDVNAEDWQGCFLRVDLKRCAPA